MFETIVRFGSYIELNRMPLDESSSPHCSAGDKEIPVTEAQSGPAG